MQFIESPNNFYLGARVDPDTHQVLENEIVYYDSRDLTTHGVILGMTGSGKTGLGIDLLEEAVVDGIPSIIIDPKGDITNMLLAFPDLTPEHFLGWINPEDAARSNHTIEEHASAEAEKWKNGLLGDDQRACPGLPPCCSLQHLYPWLRSRPASQHSAIAGRPA